MFKNYVNNKYFNSKILGNKKAITELVSFVFLTLTIIVASLLAYTFSKGYLEDNIIKYDRDNMVVFLKKFSLKSQEIQNFNDSQVTLNLYFRKGIINFEGNKISYSSLFNYFGNNEYCLDDICYSGLNYEVISLNLSNSYLFSQNFSLNPGFYILRLKNIKNEKKIEIIFE